MREREKKREKERVRDTVGLEMERQQEIQKQQEMQRQQEIQRQQEMERQQMEMQRLEQEKQQLEMQRQQEQQQMQMQMQMQQQQQQQQSTTQFSTTSITQSQSQQESFQSFSQSNQSKNVYEATASSGAMRGYQIKGNEDAGGRMSALSRDSGIFGGISADDNSLVDAEFDYKKHSVKDLAQHFSNVKPKSQLPPGILPEQRIYNGEQGPALNYRGGKADFASQQQVYTKKEVSAEDVEASRQAYEMKKKQQAEQKAQSLKQSSSTTSVVT